jgi:hypothetical protein
MWRELRLKRDREERVESSEHRVTVERQAKAKNRRLHALAVLLSREQIFTSSPRLEEVSAACFRIPFPSASFVKNPVPWTLISDRTSCATVVRDISVRTAKSATPAPLITNVFLPCMASLFISPTPVSRVWQPHQRWPECSLQPGLRPPPA